MLTAESIARELVETVGAPTLRCSRVVWRFAGGVGAEVSRRSANTYPSERSHGITTWRDVFRIAASIADEIATDPDSGLQVVRGMVWSGRPVTAQWTADQLVDLLAGLARTGYALDAVSEDAAMLLAPELSTGPART